MTFPLIFKFNIQIKQNHKFILVIYNMAKKSSFVYDMYYKEHRYENPRLWGLAGFQIILITGGFLLWLVYH